MLAAAIYRGAEVVRARVETRRVNVVVFGEVAHGGSGGDGKMMGALAADDGASPVELRWVC